jgi:hypothetical protein
MSTAQEIFTKTVQHLRKQGRRAINPDDGGCAYRGSDGTSCAVGCHIANEDYTPDMESHGLATLIALFGHRPSVSALREHLKLFGALQWAHDQGTPGSWEYDFDRLAKQFGLEVPPERAA